MLAVEEERNIVKGVELAEKTMIATTDKGLVLFSLHKDQRLALQFVRGLGVERWKISISFAVPPYAVKFVTA